MSVMNVSFRSWEAYGLEELGGQYYTLPPYYGPISLKKVSLEPIRSWRIERMHSFKSKENIFIRKRLLQVT